MPHIEYSRIALLDIVRLREYLKKRNPDVAKRAILKIKKEIDGIRTNPNRFRPVPDKINYREIVIEFGAQGYIARFFQKENGDILITGIKHQLENDFQSN